jgi:hypothetical protein
MVIIRDALQHRRSKSVADQERRLAKEIAAEIPQHVRRSDHLKDDESIRANN